MPVEFIDPEPDKPTLSPPTDDTAIVVSPATIVDDDDDEQEHEEIPVRETTSEKTEKPVRKRPTLPLGSITGLTTPESVTTKQSPVIVPGMEIEQPPGDLIEISPSGTPKSGGTQDLRDIADRVRTKKISPELERKEETVQHQWRHLLDSLATTRLVHVRLKKEIAGSFVSAGARPNMDVNHIRMPEMLVPYGNGSSVTPQRWIICVAPNTARFDDESQYRDFTFERIGPAAPPGWSLDSPLAFADQEVSEEDVSTIADITGAVITNLQQKGMLVGPGGAAPQAPAAQNPFGMMPPGMMSGFYPPFYPPQLPQARSSEDDDRRRRDEEERRRREDAEREERRKDREKFELDRRAIEERARLDAEAHRLAIEQLRKDGEKRDADWRDQRAQLERERLDADHRAQLGGVNSTVEALRKDIESLRIGGLATQQKTGATEWLALAGTLAPIVTNYLAAEREARSSERQQRAEEALRDRERSGRDTDQMMKLVGMFGESQMNAAKVSGELIQRMQDPSAMMGMTKLLTETMGGNVQLIAQLARSGLAGGPGRPSVDIGSIVGQLIETGGNIFGNWSALKERELLILAETKLVPQMPTMPHVMPTAPPMQPAPVPAPARPRPVAPTPSQAPVAAPPAQPAATPTTEQVESTKVLKVMVDTFKAAVLAHAEPRKVAKMLSAISYAAENFEVEKSDPRTAQILKALGIDPARALKIIFRDVLTSGAVAEAYLDEIAAVLLAEYTTTTSPQAPPVVQPQAPPVAQPQPQPQPQPQSPTSVAPPVASAPPATASASETASMMPGRRANRGRPRAARPVTAEAPTSLPEPVQPPTPSPDAPVPLPTSL